MKSLQSAAHVALSKKLGYTISLEEAKKADQTMKNTPPPPPPVFNQQTMIPPLTPLAITISHTN